MNGSSKFPKKAKPCASFGKTERLINVPTKKLRLKGTGSWDNKRDFIY